MITHPFQHQKSQEKRGSEGSGGLGVRWGGYARVYRCTGGFERSRRGRVRPWGPTKPTVG
eukprot:748819-Hanusia_phi.AAC.5